MTRPLCILIGAMGGEGGGVLADWLIDAAMHAGFPVQSTSVPGVAQRTGATTYYVEIFPETRASLGGREPILSLTPNPGHVDLVAASELMEAGRAIQNGYVHPDRTLLIASTHREYAVSEKAAMGDGRFDSDRVLQAAQTRARSAVLLDMRALAQQHGTVINTVLFGAMAGSGVLPFSRQACEQAIERSGKAVQASLRGFAAGFEAAQGRVQAATKLVEQIQGLDVLPPRVRALPEALHAVVSAGVELTTDYQDKRYADQYLDTVERVLALERAQGDTLDVTRETARYLGLWMCYEDVIRVAQLKTKRERLERVRREVGAKAGEPIYTTEYLKPGIGETADMLPPALARWFLRQMEGKSWHRSLYVRTDTLRGFLTLCFLRSLRVIRRHTFRHAEEHQAIQRWLETIERLLPQGDGTALEVALAGNLVKGYGETHRRGHRSLRALLDEADRGTCAETLRAARVAALADPEARQLSSVLQRPVVAQPIRIVRRPKLQAK